MGHCRFQNTYQDLLDCYDNMELSEQVSREEKRDKGRLIELCREIADEYEDEEGERNE